MPWLGGEVGQARRQPAGDVEEVELLDVGRQAAQLGREGREQRVAEGRLAGDQLAEAGAGEGERLGRLEGRRGRRPGRAVEERELAEEVARVGPSR